MSWFHSCPGSHFAFSPKVQTALLCLWLWHYLTSAGTPNPVPSQSACRPMLGPVTVINGNGINACCFSLQWMRCLSRGQGSTAACQSYRPGAHFTHSFFQTVWEVQPGPTLFSVKVLLSLSIYCLNVYIWVILFIYMVLSLLSPSLIFRVWSQTLPAVSQQEMEPKSLFA